MSKWMIFLPESHLALALVALVVILVLVAVVLFMVRTKTFQHGDILWVTRVPNNENIEK